MQKTKNAVLVLESGSSFEGLSIGAGGERIGEVVLNTAVVGYQEMMTDPTNAGKILVLTYPLIGNYGVAEKFYESKRCWINGLAIKEASRIYSNWQAERSFDEFINRDGVVVISDIDTRGIAVEIRDKGEMYGILSTKNSKKAELLKKLKNCKKGASRNYIKDISVKKPSFFKGSPSGPNIAVLDLGMLASFVRQLNALGCNVTLIPFDTGANQILAMRPDGLVVSNGPEDDEAMPRLVDTVRSLIKNIPILGISTGHEVIGLALGARLRKMKVGHHGVNYPAKGPNFYKGKITVQSHSFVIDENSIKGRRDVAITMRNINDNTIEEMESKPLKFISTQYYPSSPGFDEVNEAFRRFLMLIEHGKGAKHSKHNTKRDNEVQYAKA